MNKSIPERALTSCTLCILVLLSCARQRAAGYHRPQVNNPVTARQQITVISTSEVLKKKKNPARYSHQSLRCGHAMINAIRMMQQEARGARQGRALTVPVVHRARCLYASRQPPNQGGAKPRCCCSIRQLLFQSVSVKCLRMPVCSFPILKPSSTFRNCRVGKM